MTPELPAGVDGDAFGAALRALGIPTKGLVRIESDPKTITVTYIRRDGNGQIARGSEGMTEDSFVIALHWGGDAA